MAITYTIETNLRPQELSFAARVIFAHWVAFALGREAIGGRTIKHPSGSYASSITIRESPGSVTISASSEEAAIIEQGHQPIDMLAHLKPGKTYPIKVPGRATIFAKTPSDPSKRSASNTTGTAPGWMIPAMAAYSPAKILSDIYRRSLGSTQP